MNGRESARRIKRGGNSTLFSLDFRAAEGELRDHLPQTGESIEDYFHKEWIRSLMGLSVEALRQNCAAGNKQVHFQIFERYDLNSDEVSVSYDQLAREFSLSSIQVTNFLAAARREFRRIVLDKLREMTADEAEFRREARALLGVK